MKKVLLSLACCASFILADNFTLKSSELKGQLTNKQVLVVLDVLERIFHQNFLGKMFQKIQNLLQLQFMIQMHQQVLDGGIGLFLIFQKIKQTYLLDLEILTQKMQFKV